MNYRLLSQYILNHRVCAGGRASEPAQEDPNAKGHVRGRLQGRGGQALQPGTRVLA